MTTPTGQPTVRVGEILIGYELADDGDIHITVDLPPTQDVPAVVQLGMLAMARRMVDQLSDWQPGAP